MRRGDIHVAAARGVYAGKPRPVVIVQDDGFDATPSVTVCPLTTTPVEAELTRVAIGSKSATGIERPSSFMVDKITTMPRGSVRNRIGCLADADLAQLNRALVVFVGLAG